MSHFLQELLNDELETVRVAANAANTSSAKDWETIGLALAGEARYADSIVAYSHGLAQDPFYGLLYRHRGHRYISLNRFEEGVSDFVIASRLIPDNWDVWYHLGLGYFLMGRYEEARAAYEACYRLNYDDDSMVAITNWLWITLKRLGDNEAAQALIDNVAAEGLEIIENIGYYDLVKIYKGVLNADEVNQEIVKTDDDLSIVTIGFGLSNYYYVTGDEAKRQEVLAFVSKSLESRWKYAFGYFAAQVDLNK